MSACQEASSKLLAEVDKMKQSLQEKEQLVSSKDREIEANRHVTSKLQAELQEQERRV